MSIFFSGYILVCHEAFVEVANNIKFETICPMITDKDPLVSYPKYRGTILFIGSSIFNLYIYETKKGIANYVGQISNGLMQY